MSYLVLKTMYCFKPLPYIMDLFHKIVMTSSTVSFFKVHLNECTFITLYNVTFTIYYKISNANARVFLYIVYRTMMIFAAEKPGETWKRSSICTLHERSFDQRRPRVNSHILKPSEEPVVPLLLVGEVNS